MKRALFFWICSLLILGFFGKANAQLTPYQWQISAKKTGDGQYELTFRTTGANNWELYAPNQVLGDVKMTELVFPDSSILQEGEWKETGSYTVLKSAIFDNAPVKIYKEGTSWTATVRINGEVPAELHGKLTYTYGNENEFYPATAYDFSIHLEGGVAATTRILIPSIDIKHPVNNCGDEDTGNKSLLGIFLLGLAGGFIALLTPCVFPLIPLTVSFFTKKAANKSKGLGNALLYGFFIFLIYVLLSVPFHLVDKANPEILNNLSTNVWLNLLFFLVFVVFAVSFFGYFEIGLPAGLASKVDARSGLGNWGGIFFMALTLAIVSFSCTGPILGSLLAGVSNEGAWPLTAGLAGFGFALALPFALFAMFPKWLHSLPKSGGWLNSVKVVLGFLELAMAVKFLSNADLVKQWGLLKRELFIGIWVIIGIFILLYLLGVIRFPHDSPVKKIGRTRWAFILLFGAATIYLVPGLTNTKAANLRLISGFPPPLCYSVYKNPVNCAEKFEPLRDYDEALALARKENKPLLIDFTGWACVNCRRMEEKVWTDPDVANMMRNDFVVVSLYVDERKKLPATKQLVYKTKTGTEKSIITVGDKWATFQSENFNAVAQPQYAIISTDEKALTKTKAYTPSPKQFAAWLQCGLQAWSKSK
ncbi:MAG TPA: thioredoxin family protein [Chitinophagaceae bacterium]|nr:thioredoxin family protein [Chitinophagaceae bacterium]